ncbi:MAG TPA: universal stress protein [Chryseosolibacter sp.]|nr:universal stress protein [Chryseosolibacter sp.]
MKKILVPTDFSKSAQNAIDVASEIALKSNAQLILLHIVERAGGNSFNVEAQIDDSDGWEEKIFTMRLIEKGRKQLQALVDSLKQQGVRVKTELRMGTPFHGMRTIITDQNVDLVVMGTAGHTRMEEMIIGTNTEKVVRHARCPVLTVQKKPSRVDFKNIVYATSMSEDEEVFSKIIRRTQQMYDATVHLVRINTPGNFVRDAIVKRELDAFAKKLQIKNFTVNVFNDLSEEEGIIYFADSIKADMIAMATHGRTGFAHVLAGSIAEEVVSHARRPVLTFVTKNR